jgi:hypothetical protein
MTLTATKIDSSHESGKNFITWAWPASTTIIYNNPVVDYLMSLCVNWAFFGTSGEWVILKRE